MCLSFFSVFFLPPRYENDSFLSLKEGLLWQTLNEHFISGFGLYYLFPLLVAYSFLPSCELLNIFRIPFWSEWRGFLFGVGYGCQAPQMLFSDRVCGGGAGGLIPLGRQKNSSCHLDFSDTTPVRYASLGLEDGRRIGSPPSLCWQGWRCGTHCHGLAKVRWLLSTGFLPY